MERRLTDETTDRLCAGRAFLQRRVAQPDKVAPASPPDHATSSWRPVRLFQSMWCPASSEVHGCGARGRVEVPRRRPAAAARACKANSRARSVGGRVSSAGRAIATFDEDTFATANQHQRSEHGTSPPLTGVTTVSPSRRHSCASTAIDFAEYVRGVAVKIVRHSEALGWIPRNSIGTRVAPNGTRSLDERIPHRPCVPDPDRAAD